MRVAGRLHLAMEMRGILGIFDAGVQVRPAAEPPGACGVQNIRVFM